MDAALALDPVVADSGFARLVAAVLDDPELQAQLGAIETDQAYVAAVRDLAAANGIAIAPEAIASAIRPDPLGRSRFAAARVTLDRWPARGWMPAHAIPTDGAPRFDWTWIGKHRLTAPFYEQEVREASRRPFSRMFRTRTTLAALIDGARREAAAIPDGLIFHLSRCGSTLVSQMLAAVPHHHVASEPEPIDAVVQWATSSGAPTATQVAALRAIVGALGRDRGGTARRFFLKLDSWHAFALPLFRAAFPDTPWIFLYRDPLEVMVSQMRQRGLQTVAGGLPPHVFAIAEGVRMAGEDYCADMLRRTCAAMVAHWHLGGGMLVDYAELPGATASRIAPHFGFTPDAAEAAAMAAAAERDAKAPYQRFAADSAHKRAAASGKVREATARYLAPVHAELELLRLRQWGVDA
jgi:hypothetical protein